jgi:hypothetical protein
MILLRQQDVDFIEAHADKLHTMPFSTKSGQCLRLFCWLGVRLAKDSAPLGHADQRNVANLKLTFIERKIIEKSRELRGSSNLTRHVQYVYETRQVISNWHAHYDALLAVHDPSPSPGRDEVTSGSVKKSTSSSPRTSLANGKFLCLQYTGGPADSKLTL